MKIQILTILLLFLFPKVASSGGVSWLFEISEMQKINKLSATITLKYAEENQNFPYSCKEIKVTIKYKPELWGKTWSGSLVTKLTHQEALAFLYDSFNSGKKIRFGSFGTGLVPKSSSDTCHFLSRGLDIIEEEEGVQAVYSFHNPI